MQKISIFGQVPAGGQDSLRPIDIDRLTHGLSTVDYLRARIHHGFMYFINDVVELTKNSTHELLIRCVNDRDFVAHIFLEGSTEAQTLIELYEDVTVNTISDLKESQNYNRNTLLDDPDGIAHSRTNIYDDGDFTLSDEGVLILKNKTPGGIAWLGIEEFILKAGSDYVLKFTNESNGTAFVSYRLRWYEHLNQLVAQ
jgi:hypothetical protein